MNPPVLAVNLNLAIDKTVLIPGFRQGSSFRVEEVLTIPGGKGINVARALKSLGTRSLITGFTAGHNGRWIRSALGRFGLPARVIHQEGGESRLCLSLVDGRGVSTDVNEEGPEISPAAQRAMAGLIAREARKAKVVAVCGRMCRGLKAGYYKGLVKAAREAGAFSAFDTSSRSLKEGLAAGADIIKINSAEFSELSGGSFSPSSIERFFLRHFKRGLRYLIVTDGASPSLAASSEGLWACVPVRLGRIVTPVGAGDSFMAGFLHGFLKGYSLAEKLAFGTGCAAADCLTLGAGILDCASASRFARKALVEKIRSFHGKLQRG